MTNLNKMELFEIHKFTSIREFNDFGKLVRDYLNESYKFAYNMSFTEEGHHRRNRSGGKENRKNVRIFCDTFNGKLGEFAVYQYFLSKGIELPVPDVSIMGEGEWDNYDFEVKGMKIGVKTTKQIGHLLLLETKDWNDEGQYIPNIKSGNSDYDHIILVRIGTTIVQEMKRKQLYFNDEIEQKVLNEILKKSTYNFDIAGYADKNLLIQAIQEKNIIPQDHYLQSESTQMDAENYYIQSGDLFEINKLVENILSNK